MKVGYKEEIYNEWEDEQGIPFSWKFKEASSLDNDDELLLDDFPPFEQLVLRELDEIRKSLINNNQRKEIK